MNVRELLKRDHGIEVRISGGTGRRHDPYVVENCSVEEAALTQVQLLRGIACGLNVLWRIKEWSPCDICSATEVIVVETLWFTPTQVETEILGVYFDTRAVAGDPCSMHPLISWQGPPGSPILPYELGWLHFNKALNDSPTTGTFDHTVVYGGPGAKASIYVYARSAGDAGGVRDAELERCASAAISLNPDLDDPWPVIEMGPFAMKVFLSGGDITVVGLAVSGMYFVKVRLTYFDNSKMRELMTSTLMVLGACVQDASIVRH